MTLIQIDSSGLPEILRATRGAAGLSARAMALQIGVSHGTISAWERGISEPSVSQFMRWAEATGQAPERLLPPHAAA
ncbi:helix-turn-helix DNA binding protein [Microbacterium phage Ekko14]|uniref:Helix-turn-helix DNA binding domain protein n=2 Tax=Paopuvirus TaxID=2948855 RepID=A0A6M3SXM1_9CAUD|nr:transcriptional repressor [Microbacterium phage Kaijohn]YP_009996708.1 transcriptional repressor [Microbacterium phage Nobel]AYD84517.1 helix-turn-helix DNA binding domain protein [Microbacterium phage Miaurora]QDF16582.1 helix-turn-helix DNA binding domain protein [Microbacterium phage Hulk]QGJ91612.1 helix-turn-helix DNA binding domain protein [Microbacterium phage HarperAnne]QKY79176.1 helix-turn-helix DNA binding domain protein [Microbacterium phage TinyTruffula]QKY80461.2 helix-turn-h